MSNSNGEPKSVRLGFRVSTAKAGKLTELVAEDREFKDKTEALREALTDLLAKYGKLGTQPAKEKATPVLEGQA